MTWADSGSTPPATSPLKGKDSHCSFQNVSGVGFVSGKNGLSTLNWIAESILANAISQSWLTERKASAAALESPEAVVSSIVCSICKCGRPPLVQKLRSRMEGVKRAARIFFYLRHRVLPGPAALLKPGSNHRSNHAGQ